MVLLDRAVTLNILPARPMTLLTLQPFCSKPYLLSQICSGACLKHRTPAHRTPAHRTPAHRTPSGSHWTQSLPKHSLGIPLQPEICLATWTLANLVLRLRVVLRVRVRVRVRAG